MIESVVCSVKTELDRDYRILEEDTKNGYSEQLRKAQQSPNAELVDVLSKDNVCLIWHEQNVSILRRAQDDT